MFYFRLRDHRKDPVNFASFISDIDCRADLFCGLRHRFSKERKDFPLYDFVVAEPTNAFAEAVGGESIFPSVEGAGDDVAFDFLVSLIGIRSILQTIHGVSELAELGVSDCQFDFI
jgi:hypothetical protein